MTQNEDGAQENRNQDLEVTSENRPDEDRSREPEFGVPDPSENRVPTEVRHHHELIDLPPAMKRTEAEERYDAMVEEQQRQGNESGGREDTRQSLGTGGYDAAEGTDGPSSPQEQAAAINEGDAPAPTTPHGEDTGYSSSEL